MIGPSWDVSVSVPVAVYEGSQHTALSLGMLPIQNLRWLPATGLPWCLFPGKILVGRIIKMVSSTTTKLIKVPS